MSTRPDKAETVSVEVEQSPTRASNSRQERQINELRQRENDLQKTLSAKDSQLAVLRVRLQEVEHTLNERTQQLRAAQMEVQK